MQTVRDIFQGEMIKNNNPIRDPNIGSLINEKFYLQRLLGRGATSSVYESLERFDKSKARPLELDSCGNRGDDLASIEKSNGTVSTVWTPSDSQRRQLVKARSSQFVIERLALILAVEIALFVFVITGLPHFYSGNYRALGFSDLLVVLAILGACVSVVSFGSRWERMQKEGIERKVKAVESSLPTSILLTKINGPVLNNQLAGKLKIQFSRGDYNAMEELIASPLDPHAPVWIALITASQLESVSHKTELYFPLSSLLFFDSVGKPVAVSVLDQLAWIVDK